MGSPQATAAAAAVAAGSNAQESAGQHQHQQWPAKSSTSLAILHARNSLAVRTDDGVATTAESISPVSPCTPRMSSTSLAAPLTTWQPHHTRTRSGQRLPASPSMPSTQHQHADAGAAALAGASIAFQKPKPKPPALSTAVPSVMNSALAAATMSASASASASSASLHAVPLGSASTSALVSAVAATTARSQSPARPPLRQPTGLVSRHTTGGGGTGPVYGSASASASSLADGGRSGLGPGGTRMSSVIAATLAARSASPSRQQPAQAQGTPMPPGMADMLSRLSSRRSSVECRSSGSLEESGLDTSSLGPTMSVVSLFEHSVDGGSQGRVGGEIVGRPVVSRHRSSSPMTKRSIERQSGMLLQIDGSANRPQTRGRSVPRAITLEGPKPGAYDHYNSSKWPPSSEKMLARLPGLAELSRPQTPPKPRNLSRLSIKSPQSPPIPSSNDGHDTENEDSIPTPVARPLTATTASSEDTFMSASSMLSPVSPQSPLRRTVIHPADSSSLGTRRPTTTTPSAKPLLPPPPPPPIPPSRRGRQALAAHDVTPGNHGIGLGLGPRPVQAHRRTQSATSLPSPTTKSSALDSLTSAIVAGSLAARMTPVNTGVSIASGSGLSASHFTNQSTKPPPPPPLRKTLRKPTDSPTDDEAYKLQKRRARNGTLGKRHAYQEGSRKRWRDEITARERRRYEAVWASNRGRLSRNVDGLVNLVVRDIWTRSRLPADELAEVWELVDREGGGVLVRDGFVVGMWLIDQRLKGRKIPRQVGESVWQSAAGVSVGLRAGKR